MIKTLKIGDVKHVSIVFRHSLLLPKQFQGWVILAKFRGCEYFGGKISGQSWGTNEPLLVSPNFIPDEKNKRKHKDMKCLNELFLSETIKDINWVKTQIVDFQHHNLNALILYLTAVRPLNSLRCAKCEKILKLHERLKLITNRILVKLSRS